MNRIFKYSNPVIAAINGHTIAGGLILALCCDYRIGVNSKAKFGLNEVTIGFPLPSVFAEIVNFTLGTRIAQNSILRGILYNVEEARQLGFIHEIVEPDELMEVALSYAGQYNESQIIAYSFSKNALRRHVTEHIENFSLELDKNIPHILSSEQTVNSLKMLLESLKR